MSAICQYNNIKILKEALYCLANESFKTSHGFQYAWQTDETFGIHVDCRITLKMCYSTCTMWNLCSMTNANPMSTISFVDLDLIIGTISNLKKNKQKISLKIKIITLNSKRKVPMQV